MAEPGNKPNSVFIVSDQHRAGLTKRSGYPLDTSPTLDKLSESGVSFDHAYATCPLCGPSRDMTPEAVRIEVRFEAKKGALERFHLIHSP